MDTKTVFIESPVGNKKTTKTSYVKTGGQKPIFFGLIVVPARKRVVEQVDSDTKLLGVVDGHGLAELINSKSKELNQEGYEVTTITSVEYGQKELTGYGKSRVASGFSYTGGVLLHCKRVT